MDDYNLGQNFDEPGVWLRRRNGCWIEETRVIATDAGSIAYTNVFPHRNDCVPRTAQPQPQRVERDALAFLRKLWDASSGSGRFALELAGFNASNLTPVPHPRGQPRTPDLLYAAIAVLTEQCAGEKELARRLIVQPSSVKSWRYTARERGLLTGGGRGRRGGKATDVARRLLDGRDPETVVAEWNARTLTQAA